MNNEYVFSMVLSGSGRELYPVLKSIYRKLNRLPYIATLFTECPHLLLDKYYLVYIDMTYSGRWDIYAVRKSG